MRLRAFACSLCLLAAVAVLRADQWSRSFPLSGPLSGASSRTAALQVNSDDGDIQVTSWDRPEIDAQVVTRGWRIGRDGVDVEATQNGNAVMLRVRRVRGFWFWSWGGGEIRITLTVPRRLDLRITSGDGNVAIASVGGRIRVHTGDGNFDARDLDAESLIAGSGDGNLTVAGRFSGLDLRSGDGNIRVRAAAGSAASSPWSLHSGDGNVTLGLPAGFRADLDAQTGDGGINMGGFSLAATGKLDSHRARGALNGGGGLLVIRTGDGSIHLVRN